MIDSIVIQDGKHMRTRLLVSFILLIFPWPIRRKLMQILWGFKIHKTAHIGFSIVVPNHLEMGPGARIGHMTVCKGLYVLKMDNQSYIGNLNWITGSPKYQKKFFSHRENRMPALHLERHAAVTNRHYIDCTDQVCIGEYTTLAGVRSQLLTHAIDLSLSRQDCAPVVIGKRCFIGTGCIILPGTVIGDYCVVGAGAVLNKDYRDYSYVLLAGVPAKPIKKLSVDMLYFSRSQGFVS